MLRVRHLRVSGQPDIPAEGALLQPSDWNADHAIEGAAVRLPVGRWFDGALNGAGGAGVANGEGVLILAPLPVHEAMAVDRAALEVLVGAADSQALLVLYGPAADGGPGQQLAAALVGTGAAGLCEVDFSAPMVPGIYWLGAWLSGGAVLRGMPASACASLGWSSAADGRPAVSLLAAGLDQVAAVAGDYTGAGAFAFSNQLPPAVRLRIGARP